jgi:hypothetical protein
LGPNDLTKSIGAPAIQTSHAMVSFAVVDVESCWQIAALIACLYQRIVLERCAADGHEQRE